MKMNRVFLVLGFVLIMGLYSDAQPLVFEWNGVLRDCCFDFFTGKIPPEKILKVTKTDPRCPKKGFIVTTPKFPSLCVHKDAIE
ncbi:C-C motif chemokine 17-like [Neoarius graeffei]|uniref:C-C motif chemokine 17-like n=1 Tax=Neoarius graeffei TaxID=443677 RepID=UPI00298D03F5|nr:C-C motif chemokine 17-like [Neoarius graeffei]XP_060784454.1 C-C motif chemokine 17-like [Neoarius graeffei]